MATKTEATEKPARKPRTRKPKSLKIERKRTKKKTTTRQKTSIKAAKLDRVLRKSRTLVRRSLRKALKGLGLKRVPDKVYKKIDSAVAKSQELNTAIESAVVEAVNSLPAVKKNGDQEPATEKKPRRTRKTAAATTRKPRAKKEAAAATEKKSNGEKKNGNGKKEALAAQE